MTKGRFGRMRAIQAPKFACVLEIVRIGPVLTSTAPQ